MSQPSPPLKVLGVISSCGGGDWPPMLALAAKMLERGHDVQLVCDTDTRAAVHAAGIIPICLPDKYSLSPFFDPIMHQLLSRGEQLTPHTPNPLKNWTRDSIPTVIKSLGHWQPDLVLGSLLCLYCSEQLASRFKVPWCFLNPSFSFGDSSRKPDEKDFSPTGTRMYTNWLLPPALEATLVLHATDRLFDGASKYLPGNHRYAGSLFWEFPAPHLKNSHSPGAPWVLISLSTAPQEEDLTIVKTALAALKSMDVRILVTLSPQHDRAVLGQLPDNVVLTGYIPHSRVLPHYHLVISHAGHGLVMKAIYHGTPMVLIPWGRDQQGVARRAEALGVAAVVERDGCNAITLEKAILHAMTDSAMSKNSKAQSLRLKKRDDLTRACHHLESLCI